MTHFVHSEHRMNPPTRELAHCAWCMEASHCTASVEAALPDGAINLYLNLGNGGRRLFQSWETDAAVSPRAAWVVGPRSRTILVAKEVRNCNIVGIRLHPGMAQVVLGVRADQLAEHLVDLDACWGRSRVERLRDRLASTPSHAIRFAIVEQELRLITAQRHTRHHTWRRAIHHACLRSAAETVRELSAAAGLTSRATIAYFREHVGLTPKAFLRVARLRRVIRAIHSGRCTPWTQVALDAGYFDQAHFIHDFRRLTGFSPAEYELRRMKVGEGFVRYRSANAGP